MRTIVAGNWKMNLEAASAARLLDDLGTWSVQRTTEVEMIVAPPFPFLSMAVDQARRARGMTVAAQNCHYEESGAFTGEVGVPMLKSLGVGACIVGHSERREFFGETDVLIGRKILLLLQHGLTPIYCCGEKREDREAGRHREVVAQQIKGALAMVPATGTAQIVVAYEPVWAIGTGLTATPAQAQEMHAFIRHELKQFAGPAAQDIPILYGGSCKPDNARGLFVGADINGGLIGGAALQAGPFRELIEIAEEVKCPH